MGAGQSHGALEADDKESVARSSPLRRRSVSRINGSAVADNDADGESHGVFAVQERLMAQEKQVAEMETSSLLLNEYHQQLDAIANQAMLLCGFVMGTIGPQDLYMIGNPEGTTCYSKSYEHFVCTLLLLIATELCICFCVLCIAASAYTVMIGREAYLHVGWLIAVYLSLIHI